MSNQCLPRCIPLPTLAATLAATLALTFSPGPTATSTSDSYDVFHALTFNREHDYSVELEAGSHAVYSKRRWFDSHRLSLNTRIPLGGEDANDVQALLLENDAAVDFGFGLGGADPRLHAVEVNGDLLKANIAAWNLFANFTLASVRYEHNRMLGVAGSLRISAGEIALGAISDDAYLVLPAEFLGYRRIDYFSDRDYSGMYLAGIGLDGGGRVGRFIFSVSPRYHFNKPRLQELDANAEVAYYPLEWLSVNLANEHHLLFGEPLDGVRWYTMIGLSLRLLAGMTHAPFHHT